MTEATGERQPRTRSFAPADLLDEHDAGAGRSEMRTAVGAGVRWMGPTQVLVQVVRLASTYALSWLLLPSDFGIVALVTVVTGLFERVLGDTGTTTALVRHPKLTQGLASSVLFWNITIGATTSAMFVLAGTPIAALLGEPSAAGIVRVLGLLAFVNSLSYVPQALFRRQLRFRQLATVMLVNAVITGGGSVALAFAGLDVWAIVLGNVSGSVAATIVAWTLVRWRPAAHFSRRSLSEISGFSGRLSVQNIFGYISFAGDRFIIGRLLGTSQLGFYSMGNRLMLTPVQTATQTYRQVVFPNLSRIQDDFPALARTFRRSVSGISFALFPLCATVAAVAQPLVSVVLADKWAPVGIVLLPIAMTAGLQSVAATSLSLYNVRGRADLSLRWQICSSMVLLVCYLVGTTWDIEGVAWGYFTGTALLMYPAFAIPLRLIGASTWAVMRDTVVNGVAAALGGLLGYGAATWADRAGASDVVQLLAGSAVSAAVYAAYVLIVRPPALRDLLLVLRR